ncbi:MAG: hypothetical protein ACFFCS_25850, partial [Candidatus Hodarchaeota archaeon]
KRESETHILLARNIPCNTKGKRQPRGLFTSKNGYQIHSDVNGVLNIMKLGVPDSFDDYYEQDQEGRKIIKEDKLKLLLEQPYKVNLFKIKKRQPKIKK